MLSVFCSPLRDKSGYRARLRLHIVVGVKGKSCVGCEWVHDLVMNQPACGAVISLPAWVTLWIAHALAKVVFFFIIILII